MVYFMLYINRVLETKFQLFASDTQIFNSIIVIQK